MYSSRNLAEEYMSRVQVNISPGASKPDVIVVSEVDAAPPKRLRGPHHL